VQTTPENEDEFLLHLSLVSEDPRVAYIVAGREVAPTTGQTHLQCFVRCHARQSFACLQALLPPCHLERARGSAEQGVRYCRKDGDYVEFGDVPNCDQRGRRTDWERFCDWARHLDAQPTDREIIEQFPSLFGRYAVSCRRIASELCQSTPLRQGELRPGKQPCMLACKKMLMIGQLNSSSTETEDSESLGSADTWSDESMESKSSDQESETTSHTASK